MNLAYIGYPLLNALWTMVVFFLWIMFIWLLVTVWTDIFRRDDIDGWAKALWTVFTLLVPFLGVFVYLIVQGRAMQERKLSATTGGPRSRWTPTSGALHITVPQAALSRSPRRSGSWTEVRSLPRNTPL